MTDGRDIFYDEAIEAASDECEAEPLDAEHPLFVLYTSGSTAKPKGILHTTGGYLTGVAWTTKHVFDLKPDEDLWWCSADVGWVTGHSYIVYGPLMNGMTSVMYEGAPGLPAQGHLVGAVRALRRDGLLHGADGDPRVHEVGRRAPAVARPLEAEAARHGGRADQPEGLALVLEGDRGRALPDRRHLVADGDGPHHGLAAPGPHAGEARLGHEAAAGVEAVVLDEEGNEVEDGEQGLLALVRPWPGMLRTLYRDPDRFKETYFSKWDETRYYVGDAARKDEDGYIWVIGRADDAVNVSGHLLSTAEVESAIVSHPKVAEAAVIGQEDEDTGQAISAFVILEGETDEGDEELEGEIRERVAQRIGKFARPKRIIWTADVPKTRSGKIMRRLLRDIAEGRELGDVTTLREPGVMKDLEEKFAGDEA